MVTQTPTRTADRKRSPTRCPSEKVQEYYRSLLCRLPGPGNGASRPLQTLGITSCCRGEGVSMVASQLAATAASTGRGPVLLVDSNLASPSAERTFELDPGAGLAEVLLKGRNLLSCIQPSPVRNLSVLTAGDSNGQETQVYDPGGLAEMLDVFKGLFKLVVFDMPPAGQSGLAVRLASLMDGVLLVVEAERIRWEVARRATEELRRSRVPLLGAVLNKQRQHVPGWLYRTL